MDEVGDKQAMEEAARWLARLNSRAVSTEDLNAFYEWRRDPINAAAYARGEQLWHDAHALGDDADIATAVREALERPRLGRERRLTRRNVLVGGGALAATAATGIWWLTPGSREYRTDVGEQLLVTLDDGSHMRLNTNSGARVSFTVSERRVDLMHGQILFEVERDTSRPFRVVQDGMIVEALGTRFEVSAMEQQAPRVLLVEGRIAVSAAGPGWREELARPGARLVVGGDGRPLLGEEDIERATSWTAGRIVFHDTALVDAIGEINRYSRTRIELAAPDHAALRVDGIFETGDPAAFVSAVTVLYPHDARRDGNVIVLSSR